jgi:tetratricopeptide (TPR) repeat protein
MLSKNKFITTAIFLAILIASLSTIMIKGRPLSSSEYVALAKEKMSNFNGGYKVKEVLAHYDRAIEIDPNNIDAYNGRGDLYSRSREYMDYNESNLPMLYEYQDLAIDDFNKAIKVKPNAESYIRRASLKIEWVEKNESIRSLSGLELVACREAEEDINKALELNPNYSEAYHLRGGCKSRIHSDKKGALQDYDKSIELDPKNIDAYYSRASLKIYEFNDREGALQDYDRAVQINPYNPLSYSHRGSFKDFKLEDKRGAISDYEQELKLYQEYGRPQEQIERVKSKIRRIESIL